MARNLKNPATLFVMLECLLDVRIATVARMSQEAAVKTLRSNYDKREEDVFPVDMERYRELYRARDVETLQHASLTKCIYFIQGFIRQMTQQIDVRPFHDGIKIIVNTFPYRLDPAEMQEIELCLWHHLKEADAIEVVYKPLEDVTPAWCRDNVSAMIMYDYGEWVAANVEDFKTCPIPQVTLFAPAIYFNHKPTEEEMKDIENMNPMAETQRMASIFIDLRLLPVDFVNLIK